MTARFISSWIDCLSCANLNELRLRIRNFESDLAGRIREVEPESAVPALHRGFPSYSVATL